MTLVQATGEHDISVYFAAEQVVRIINSCAGTVINLVGCHVLVVSESTTEIYNRIQAARALAPEARGEATEEHGRPIL